MALDTPSTRAIVTRGSHKEGKWNMENIKLRPLRDDELLVRIVASGVCHTDIVFGDKAEAIGGYPRVMGHEGTVNLRIPEQNVLQRKLVLT
jgi:Zn-dependent alcohol dehydrogenase